MRFETSDFRLQYGRHLETQISYTRMQTIILQRDRFYSLVIFSHKYTKKLPIAKGSFFVPF